MRRLLDCLLIILTMLGPSAVPCMAQEQALEVTPAKPRQGDALFVRLRAADVEDPRARWRGGTYSLYRQGDGWAVVLPVVPDTPTGTQALSVTFTRGGRTQKLEEQVAVGPTRYAVEHLKMAAKTARLYSFPGAKKEDAAVSTAIRVRTEERLWSGDWAVPAKGRLSTPFGSRRIRNGRPVGRHKGQDISAPTGTPIVAPAAGKVVLAASYRKYGNCVVLDHGQGVTSLYLHMSRLAVRRGQSVARGEEIGLVGSTGVSTGPHLHWSVYAQGQAVHPLFFTRLGKAGVRLTE